MGKILYATDFSENAQKAFSYASRLAKKHSADLIMLHVFDLPTEWNYPQADTAMEMEREAVAESESKLKRLFDEHAGDQKENIRVNYLARGNTSVVKGILSEIKANDPGLVVIGTKGGSKVKETLVGSTAKALIKQAPVPVLTIPENAAGSNFEKALYATDFREEDITAIQHLTTLVRPFDGEITVVHISPHNEYKGDEKMDWFKDLVQDNISYAGIRFQLLLSDDIYEQLNSYINQAGFDLLAMLEKEREGIIDKFFHRDLVKKMEFHTTIPLLSFNEHFLRMPDKKNMNI